MKDLLDNDICIGDKVVFPIAYFERKELDYGIVEKMTKDGKACWCKSFRYTFPAVLRRTYQVIKYEKS